MDERAVIADYGALLGSVGDPAGEIGSRPVETHWSHVGSAYPGLVIVGQAVYGWGDDSGGVTVNLDRGRRAVGSA